MEGGGAGGGGVEGQLLQDFEDLPTLPAMLEGWLMCVRMKKK